MSQPQISMEPGPLLVQELRSLGVSMTGVQQFLAGQVVTNPADRARLATIKVDPSDPLGNTFYVGSSNGGVWHTGNVHTVTGGLGLTGLSALGADQFFAGLPVTSQPDRLRLPELVADALRKGSSRTRIPRNL